MYSHYICLVWPREATTGGGRGVSVPLTAGILAEIDEMGLCTINRLVGFNPALSILAIWRLPKIGWGDYDEESCGDLLLLGYQPAIGLVTDV